MRLRTQLVVAFLVLAVLPLAGIVFYSYTSSIRSFRRAVESETEAMTVELGERMGSIRSDLETLVDELGLLVVPLIEAADSELGLANDRGEPGDRSRRSHQGDRGYGATYSQLVAGIGAAADLVEWFELSLLHRDDSGPADLSTDASRQPQPDDLIIFPSETLASALARLERLRDRDAETQKALEAALVPILGSAIRRRRELSENELVALEASAAHSRRVFGFEFRSPVESGGRTIGFLRVHVRPQPVLRRVLGRSQDLGTEIPYALGADGTLHTAEPEARDLLAGLIGKSGGRPTLTGLHADWIAVETEPDPPGSEAGGESASTLVFGIARPIRGSLAGMRQTAARNFIAGLGVGGLALLGVLWFSSRLTHRLGGLTRGAERLAEGDWQVRVPASSKDELGQLARTFNRMALQLSEKEQRLLEEERRRKDQEMQQRLLAAENDRKTRELEEARRFQLSLLPRQIPQLPSVDIAVNMRTATEVGGDYYDFFVSDDDSLVAAVGDATGHGSRAGTMTTVIKGMLSLATIEDLPGFLGEANQAICAMRLERMAMSLTLLRVAGRQIEIAAAGMPPALLRRAATGALEEIALQGSPLGGIASFAYSLWQGSLDPGDTLVVMSDGFPELLNARGQQLGYARARAIFERAADRSPAEIVAAMTRATAEWNGDRPPNDDVTFVVFRAKGAVS